MSARIRALAVLVAVFLLGTSTGVVAYRFYGSRTQSPANVQFPPGKKAQQRPRLQELLNMSAEQKSRFEDIWKEFRPRFEALRDEQERKFDAARTEFEPRMTELRNSFNQKVSSILNEEQKQKFDALQKEMGNRHRRSGPPGPPPDRSGPPPSQ